jgi:hypothetical protein
MAMPPHPANRSKRRVICNPGARAERRSKVERASEEQDGRRWFKGGRKMELVRLGRTGFRRPQNSVNRNAKEFSVQVFFRAGPNLSDFCVDFKWTDVETLIAEFAAIKEARALSLKQAASLAAELRRSGWFLKRQNFKLTD